ncbi:MAG TPA: hypothetical protein VKB28_14020 [Solirubrobacteraceae bacterium]|nr:hypothetical protein [Solirubrobacteraceae bacterium]
MSAGSGSTRCWKLASMRVASDASAVAKPASSAEVTPLESSSSASGLPRVSEDPVADVLVDGSREHRVQQRASVADAQAGHGQLRQAGQLVRGLPGRQDHPHGVGQQAARHEGERLA